MSLFSNSKPQGGQRKNAFDLSRRDIFSVKSGVLNVCFIQHTIPEAKYEVSHAQITRTDPIQTAPFARMSENFEYYFIPYSQLYSDFERLYYERGDKQRNPSNLAFSSSVPMSSRVPVMNLRVVVGNLVSFFINSRLALKMAEQSPIAFQNLKKLWYDHFNVNNMTDYSDSSPVPFDVHGEICIDEMLKLFDNLGYGNYYAAFANGILPFFAFDTPVIEQRYYDSFESATSYLSAYNTALAAGICNALEVSFDDAVFSGDYSTLADYFYEHFRLVAVQSGHDYVVTPYWNTSSSSWWTNMELILEFFEDDPTSIINDMLVALTQHRRFPSILPLASFVKVFSDIYRNTQYDVDNYSALFNFDYVTSDELSVVPTEKVLSMLIPRFRQYKKDIFTGTFPSAQFGAVSVSSLNNPSTLTAINATSSSPKALYSTSNVFNGKIIQTRDSSNPTEDNSTILHFNIDSGVSALAIRQALSLQRYKERILRAGNRITSLQDAVFGDRSRFLENNYVQFIGAEHNNIDFNSVAATSDAGNSEVGQLGAHGVGTHIGKAFEFHSHDFGILLGIYYVLPESEYESYALYPDNMHTESNDFYKPDFMNLGLTPVFNYDFNLIGRLAVTGNDDTVLGYLANYWSYKTSIDRVHGNFYASSPFAKNLSLKVALAYSRGVNSHFVTPRSSSAFISVPSLGQFYVNPHDIDTIFYVNSDFTIDTDQFKVNCNHDVKALLPMSVVGLPEF